MEPMSIQHVAKAMIKFYANLVFALLRLFPEKVDFRLRQKYKTSMVDSIIAATTQTLKAPCVTDDHHIKNIKEIETKWIL